jgi:hypothetical protein
LLLRIPANVCAEVHVASQQPGFARHISTLRSRYDCFQAIRKIYIYIYIYVGTLTSIERNAASEILAPLKIECSKRPRHHA